MKAAIYEHQGTPRDVLAVRDLPTPEPGPGEVRVRVHFSGVNPTDIKARDGFAGPMRYPRVIPHQDGAGQIDAVGPGVGAHRVGERVWVYEAQFGRPNGTAADWVVVPSANAVRLPDNSLLETGACLGIPAMTAHRCLFADGPLHGRRVLVQGGAGAVGTAAILLAKWAGAWVATTVSNKVQATVASRAGADLVILRTATDVATAVRIGTDGIGVDRIIEVNVVANLETDLACLAPGGVISSYAFTTPGESLSVPLFRAMEKGALFRFVFTYTTPRAAKDEAIRDITSCLVAGAYHPAIGLCVPLADIVEAHEKQEGGVVGKVLLDLMPPPAH
ncbi:NADPH2:quinone reductase [Luteibacter sp. 621]|uniref:NADPH:quinone reductase n=1 Tax=Luteibacter sp. 621 TaxID=3373916 RepID=UPI003D22CB88